MASLNDMTRAQLVALLDWYRSAGVDLAVAEAPVDRFARIAIHPAAANPRPKPAPEPRPLASGVASGLGGDPAEARALAASAPTLEALRQALDAYDGCPLKFRATQLVFADGNPEARIMLIGEAPGAEEDRLGRPFVGRSGQLLDRMLGAIGLDRNTVYIANTIPWRPPGNREPTPEEIALCVPFLVRQVELVAPRMIVTLGGLSTRLAFDTRLGILKMRGRVGEIRLGQHSAPALPMLHPAYLLRNPAAKAHAWRDMLTLAQSLEDLGLNPKKA